ncbi:hypothetical protein PspLS_00733 [Pyricularia sp. CBS 133598]|nr:hypothetical protein PspLS_00733 [Pyricularia sp. CBS 133598]
MMCWCAGLGIESKDLGKFEDSKYELCLPTPGSFGVARQPRPGLELDTIEGWGVHPIIVVTARDWARMSAGGHYDTRLRIADVEVQKRL